jgi:hypothetical protein
MRAQRDEAARPDISIARCTRQRSCQPMGCDHITSVPTGWLSSCATLDARSSV